MATQTLFIYSLTLQFGLILFSLLNFLIEFYSTARYKVRHFIYYLWNRNYEPSCLNEAKKDLLNLPQHLSLIIEAEKECISVDSIAKLIRWTQLLGIAYISIYDYSGLITLKKEEVVQKLSGKENNNKKLKCEKDALTTCVEHVSTIKSCFHYGSSKVALLDATDGRPAIVSAIKFVINDTNGTPITYKKIIDCLKAKFGFPEPDAIFKFGSSVSALGFPPLFLRISEMFSLKSYTNVTVFQFIDVLKSYEKRDRRCGK
ncbi:hypothetical protein B4U79_18357 [Dinothrombium tinctorium]|uniref:ditrans,polycis-polyprenyl diphosphate synthase [(2E,6E)-farnesyldiphosphate specific] n=1 Tax=Dinothrombium tinctorium TaxID=1965070 RepID=A0A3S3RTS0_9ACAR|nr:hypothetical protein B4U79_18357 [Dinothrombium tinctorium]